MFTQIVVLDLEMNPVARKHRDARTLLGREVVEIGAVKLDAVTYAVSDRFTCFVKPAYSANIAQFITDLTGIRTSDIAKADDFATALGRFMGWLGSGKTCIYTWSDTDFSQLQRECAYKNVEFPFNNAEWVDAQPLYPARLGLDNHHQMSLHDAAEWHGVSMDGKSTHRALYDAEVTADLVRELLSGECERTAQRLQNYRVLADKQTGKFSLGISLGEVLRAAFPVSRDTEEFELA